MYQPGSPGVKAEGRIPDTGKKGLTRDQQRDAAGLDLGHALVVRPAVRHEHVAVVRGEHHQGVVRDAGFTPARRNMRYQLVRA